MQQSISLELVKLIPSILWFFFMVALVIKLYRPIRYELLPKLSGIKALGVEMSFIRESIDAALQKAKEHDQKSVGVQLAEKSPQWKVVVPPEDRQLVIERALNHQQVLSGTQMLWVDDHPENNLNERRMFKQLKVDIDTAKSTTEALEMLKFAHYQIILSDMLRDQEKTAGLEFLKRLREIDLQTPVIFYIGVIDPERGTPAQSFGLTNRPDELLHLVIDAVERKKS
ncbi:response regulator [candidate division KSB1 bacterium]|nr:response regulator [candidate division KSB1 bacterium]